MVDWKKDIKLGDLVGRKTDAGRDAVTPPEAFHARNDVAAVTEEPTAAPEQVATITEERSAPPPQQQQQQVATVVEEQTAPATEPQASAPEVSATEASAPEVQAAPEAKQKTSFWKRELSVGKSKDKSATEGDKPARRQLSAFAATPGKTPAAPTPAEAPRTSRFTRVTRADLTKETKAKTKEPKQPKEPKERKPSRFARPATSPAADGVATPKRSPLSRDLSLSFRRRPKTSTPDAKATTPKARGKKKAELVGLKVGASHIAAAQVSANGGGLELVQYARESLERGIVVGGELRDPEALGTHLKEFFRKHNLPQKAVRLGIGTNRIGVRRLEITGLADASHLENAIRFRAQEVLPIPLEEAVLDYQVVGESEDEKGQKTYRVLLVVAYRDLVQRYVRACKEAGLKLVGIDLEAFALLRSLGPTKDAARDDAAVVIVSIGHDRSTFVVADGDTCEFARVLDWGGGALDVAVARVLDKTPSQVELIKMSLTLNSTQERLEGHTQEQAVAVYEAVRKELQTFVRELVSSLHFYQNQPGSLGIGEITISGGTAQLPGLAAELQRLIGVTVRVGDPFTRVTGGKRDEIGELGSAAVAIGLGIED